MTRTRFVYKYALRNEQKSLIAKKLKRDQVGYDKEEENNN